MNPASTNRDARVSNECPAPLGPASIFGLTAQEARADIEAQGLSVAGWARRYEFDVATVRAVLSGKRGCRFGKGHAVAVALGMKPSPRDRLGPGLYRHPALSAPDARAK